MQTSSQRLNENETRFLGHMVRWGSDGYPVMRVGRQWSWNEAFGINGAPTVYKTKRAAFEAVETYLAVLRDRKAGRA